MSFAGTDLASTLSLVLLALVGLVLIVSIGVARAKRRGSRTITLDLGLTLSGWWLALCGLGVVFVVVKMLTGDVTELDGSTFSLAWPSGLPCDHHGTATQPTLWCGTASASYLTVEHASLGVRVLAASWQLLQVMLWALPAIMISIICFQTLHGRAFARTVTRSLIVGAIGVAVLGFASELLSGIATTVALREVFTESSRWYPQTFRLSFGPLSLLAAVGIAALAAVFRQGMQVQTEKDRLQSDNERLQDEKKKLQKDTEGLV